MRIKRIIEYLYDKQTNEKTRHILYIEQKKGRNGAGASL